MVLEGQAELGLSSGTAPPHGRAILLLVLGSGVLLAPLNSSMIGVALGSIRSDFRIGFDEAAWLIAAHYLASAVAQPAMGRLSDRHGRRRLFLTGLAIVAAASAVAPLASSFGMLVALRALQAVGSSTLFPAGVGIVRHALSERRVQALGTIAMFASGSAALGPAVGGGLVAAAGWEAIFLVNLPITAAVFALALRVLPPDRTLHRAGGRRDATARALRALDVPGMAAFAVALLALLWFLLAPGWPAATIAVVAGALFFAQEHRVEDPFIDVRALRADRRLRAVYEQVALINMVFYAVFFGMPSFLEEARGFTPGEVGLLMLPLAGLGALATFPAARLVERVGIRTAQLVGAGSLLGGSAMLTLVDGGTPVVWAVLALAVLGASAAFSTVALQAALESAAAPNQIGTVTGLFMTARYVATVLSTSVLAAAFGKHVGESEMRHVALVMTGLAAMVLFLTLRGPRSAARLHPDGGSPPVEVQ